ncbi:hypothetical protein F0562_013767 [Nyssa sinensis]|uniref:Uncharacterized protein n=1 Tax=Nyssa sinensis TaxID=561372 RepID=A0A5J4ZQZ9_9ASTE|nr:hypothetical protein F0562_013767 [Nyssa sinensis]
MTEEAGKSRGVTAASGEQLPQNYYGTFQGVATYSPPPPDPVTGFPQPIPPPGNPHYYSHGYQTAPGYAVVEGRPVREHSPPLLWYRDWLVIVSYWFLSWCHSLVHWSFYSTLCTGRLQRKTWTYCMHDSCYSCCDCCYPWCDKGDS